MAQPWDLGEGVFGLARPAHDRLLLQDRHLRRPAQCIKRTVMQYSALGPRVIVPDALGRGLAFVPCQSSWRGLHDDCLWLEAKQGRVWMHWDLKCHERQDGACHRILCCTFRMEILTATV